MHYTDLTSYKYFKTSLPIGPLSHNLYKNWFNIGWLGKGYEFAAEDFPEKQDVIKKLSSKKLVHLCRGFHECEFCVSRKTENGRTFILRDKCGNGEYIVDGDGKSYSAPALIIHYIEAHNYRPPQEFIDALLK